MKIQVNTEVRSIYELSDKEYDRVTKTMESKGYSWKDLSDCEIAQVYKNNGKLILEETTYQENPISNKESKNEYN